MLINIAVNLKNSKMKMNENENECTIVSSKLSTNRVGIKNSYSCILRVISKIEFFTSRVYANAFHVARFRIRAFLKHK